MLLKSKKIALCGLGLLVYLNILAWQAVFDLNSQCLEVVFFDIGQGDAVFIKTPQKHQILIDGGPSSEILEKLGKEMPFWDRTIDLIILTHPKYDHIVGLIEVLKRYKVEQILWTGVVYDTSYYKKWQDLLKQEKAKISIAHAGQRITWSMAYPGSGWIEILYPFDGLEGKRVKNINNSSIVSRLVFGQNSFLFTGDILKSVERQLILAENSGKYVSLNSDVLKVAHHGSKTSSAEEFIERVNPEIAVIQCGKNNKYGHPHQETLATLKKFDIKILRTDRDGDIKIISDGQVFSVKK